MSKNKLAEKLFMELDKTSFQGFVIHKNKIYIEVSHGKFIELTVEQSTQKKFDQACDEANDE